MSFKNIQTSVLSILFMTSLSYAEEFKKSDESLVKKRPSLVDRSTLLANGSHWAMIPKTALLFTPVRYADKVVTKPQGSLLSWDAFLNKNRGWIHTHEVSIQQAGGKEPIDPKVIDAYKRMGKLVVATYNKNPITVTPSSLSPPQNEVK